MRWSWTVVVLLAACSRGRIVVPELDHHHPRIVQYYGARTVKLRAWALVRDASTDPWTFQDLSDNWGSFEKSIWIRPADLASGRPPPPLRGYGGLFAARTHRIAANTASLAPLARHDLASASVLTMDFSNEP